MVRAIIYLKGGEDNSGKFMYMKGTHNRDYYVEHKLSEDQIRDLQETKIEAAFFSSCPSMAWLFSAVSGFVE
jgi:hypothetical protein